MSNEPKKAGAETTPEVTPEVAAAAPEAGKAKGPKPVKMLRIVAKKEGFRRAGVAHTEAATLYPMDHFTDEQIEALKGESLLVVDVVRVDPATGEVL